MDGWMDGWTEGEGGESAHLQVAERVDGSFVTFRVWNRRSVAPAHAHHKRSGRAGVSCQPAKLAPLCKGQPPSWLAPVCKGQPPSWLAPVCKGEPPLKLAPVCKGQPPAGWQER